MAIQIKRMYLDFIARDYATNHPRLEILSGGRKPLGGGAPAGYLAWVKGKEFTLRCYLSLQGEDGPMGVCKTESPEGVPSNCAEQTVYRYDWAFGVTLIEGFHWNWRDEFPKNGALAIHLILQPVPFDDGLEAIPVAAVLSALHPSKNTRSLMEQVMPALLKGSADIAQAGSHALPPLDYLSRTLTLGSNVLDSVSGNQKNWFLYQFLDGDLKCPVVEWRINKEVLIEYGPLIRGSLFLAFQKPMQPNDGKLRIQLRPQLHYCESDELCYIIPTNELEPGNPVFIDVCPA